MWQQKRCQNFSGRMICVDSLYNQTGDSIFLLSVLIRLNMQNQYGKNSRNIFTSNYWCLHQNSCFWNICFEKKPNKSVVKTSTFTGIYQQIFEIYISENSEWLLSLELKLHLKKFILASQLALLLKCKICI